jgi:hypothetical protein
MNRLLRLLSVIFVLTTSAFANSITIPPPVLNMPLTLDSGCAPCGPSAYAFNILAPGGEVGLVEAFPNPAYTSTLTIWFPNAQPGSYFLTGTLSDVTFSSKTDDLTATFTGYELVRLMAGSQKDAVYSVLGTFEQNLSYSSGGGTGLINITSVHYDGTGQSPVPEPGTFALMGTGLCGIVGVVREKVRRKLKRG